MKKDVYKATGDCGLLVGAVAIMPEHAKDTAKHVASWVKDGFQITRVTAAHVRQAEWCTNRGKCKECKESDK